MKLGVTLMLVGSMAVAVTPAAAQTVRGSVQGVITDVTGAVITGVQVVITGDASGVTFSTTTDDRGAYLFVSLAPGGYVLEASRAGFRRHSQSITLLVNQRLRFDVHLETGPVTEVVTVKAPRPGIEMSPGSLTTRFLPVQIANLPLDGRNFLDLSLLAPGSAPSALGSAGSVRGDFAFNVNGGREDANSYLLDGAYNFDPKLNAVGVRPPVDAIREFEVVGSVPDVSFGKSSGAQINVVTRSGANRVSATAYEFLRTKAFNARNFFAPEHEPAPEYMRHQYGASLGGPISRNKVFFFGDYEGTWLREGITRVTNVPTLEEREGDFSHSLFAPPTVPGFGVPFPGNKLPQLHPIGHAIALLYPQPNRSDPFANFVSSPEFEEDAHQLDARMDVVRPSLTITGRYSFSKREIFEPFAGPAFSAVPGYGNNVPRRADNFIASAVHSLGSSWVNEPRVSWTRVANKVNQQGQGTSVNHQIGLPDLSDDPRDWGLSFISVTGFSPLGQEYNNPQQGTTNFLQVSDALSWRKGRHFLKMGGEGLFITQEAFRDVQARGLIQFTQQAFTGNALADLLLGLPTVSVGAVFDNPQNLETHSTAFYFQDLFQVSTSLTLSLGVRYEMNSPPVDADDRVSIYDPASGAIVPVGQNGIPRGGYDPDRNNIGPRIGMAFAPSDRTTIRGGYGLLYDQASLAPNEFLYFNLPYYDLSTYFTVPNLYTLTLADPWPANFPLPLPKSATSVQRDLQTGFVHQWNLSYRRRLDDRLAVQAAYVGSMGRHLVAARDINQPAPSTDVPNLRPNPFFADITAIESRARSQYHAAQLSVDRSFGGGLAFSATYTIGQSMDDASAFFASAGDANFPMDSNNPEGEWARSNFDVRHRFTFSGLYELPFGASRRWLQSGAGAAILGDWDIYFVGMVNSGQPFTVAVHPDIDISNTGRANLGFGSNDRPNLTGAPGLSSPSETQWFNTAAFSMPDFGTFGNAPRNVLDGPGYKNVNLSFAKRIAAGSGAVQVRLEIFNLFNWTNFGLPDNFLGSPTFGQIFAAGAPRRLQIGVKYVF